jgi:hypothetical protein
MGHNIVAVIGAPADVARVVSVAGCPAPTKLEFGLEIVPLGHQQIDRLTALKPGEYFEGTYLSAGLQRALMQAAGDGSLAYIETNYFGGTGSQAAALFSAGNVIMRASLPIGREPASRDDPINTALRALGVRAAGREDEFGAIGLGRFRDLESLGLKEWDDD